MLSVQYRNKWTEEKRSLNVGDLVLIKNEINLPGIWPLGIVERLYPGKDVLSRAVDVRTATTTLNRPAVNLVLLHENKDL